MLDYLKGFFDEYEFTSTERSALAIAYQRIKESPRARSRFSELVDGYKRDIKTITVESEQDVNSIAAAAGIHKYTAALLAVICLSRTLRERMARIGLSKKVIFTTLADIRIKMRACESLFGVVGTHVFYWYVRFFELRLFGLGRLQFELKSYDGEKYEHNGKTVNPGDKILNVHIPADGTPLEEKAANASYREARKLFCTLLGVSDIPFCCTSWLLYSKNREFLDPKSNIVKFMNRYDIIKEESLRKDRNDAIPFLYLVSKETPIEDLPEKTSLQRSYKKHMLDGGRMGIGYGIMFLEDPKTAQQG